jgi:hypothetical protein
MIHGLEDEIVDKEEISKEEKAIQKKINKLTRHAIYQCIQNGAYTEEKLSE